MQHRQKRVKLPLHLPIRTKDKNPVYDLSMALMVLAIEKPRGHPVFRTLHAARDIFGFCTFSTTKITRLFVTGENYCDILSLSFFHEDLGRRILKCNYL